jgi:D-glycero-D-manno-heptose 1,7-bisphosphate phosphatase
MSQRRTSAQAKRRALFLDRDGVINFDRGYVHRIDDFEFVPGIFELVRYAVHDLGWPVVVATNQSGIGRGLFDEKAYNALTQWMCGRFRAERAPLTRVYHCPYHETLGIGAYRVDHPWRKPKPGMLLQAAEDLGVDLPGSVLIGDGTRDMEAARAAGISARIQIVRDDSAPSSAVDSWQTVKNLGEALMMLRARCDVQRQSAQ